jgi:hypothetical protein
VDDIQSYRCHCASGFKGIHCEGKVYMVLNTKERKGGERVHFNATLREHMHKYIIKSSLTDVTVLWGSQEYTVKEKFT